jgi:alkylhydroperoxidase/carboxymuconolactone decarboxylase family protein YurZ
VSSTETREQQIQRLIERHTRDRNMDPRSIEETYKFTHVGIEIDPDFFEARLDMGWGFFKDEPRHLDHITRNMIIFVYLAYRRSTGCFHQGRKAVMMGATYEQMVEALESAHVAGGGLTLHHGFEAIKRMKEEGLVPGSQEGPWRNHWVEFDIKENAVQDPKVKLPMTQDEVEANIRAYYSEELGARKIADDLVFAARIDPDWWMRYCRLAWGVYHDKPAFLDRIRREFMILGIVAFQAGRSSWSFTSGELCSWDARSRRCWRRSR